MEPPSNQSDLSREAEALREAWMRHDDVFLKDYLVSDVEDPRIHQSAQTVVVVAWARELDA